MPAELGLYRILGVFSLLQLGHGLTELRHHLLGSEPAKIAPFLACGTGGFFLGQFGKVATHVQFGDDLFRLILTGKKNMTCLVLLHIEFGQALLVHFFQFRVLDLRFAHGAFQRGAQDQVLADSLKFR